MHGDFTRDPLGYAPEALYVLAQQGRVQLDADWNAMATGLVESVRRSMDALLGGSAAVDEGFLCGLKAPLEDVAFGAGTYFVDGYRVTTDREALTLRAQPWRLDGAARWWPEGGNPVLVYLDVWVRNVTAIGWPDIRETALGGPDTTTRGVLTWQLRACDLEGVAGLAAPIDATKVRDQWSEIVAAIRPVDRGQLRVFVADQPGAEPCMDDGPGGYTGPGNHLYRFEVDGALDPGKPVRLRWSRDNASVEWPVLSLGTSSARILARPGARPEPNDWLELVDEVNELDGQSAASPRRVARVRSFDPDTDEVTLDASGWVADDNLDHLVATATRLRRWDGLLELKGDEEVAVEHGIRVQVRAPAAGGTFHPGDYWLAAARVASGLIWPDERWWPASQPSAGDGFRSPAGPVHHLAPLALWTDEVTPPDGCRWVVKSLRTP